MSRASKTVTAWPSFANSAAQVRPAGPPPTTATFFPVALPAESTFTPFSAAQSVTNRWSRPMATGGCLSLLKNACALAQLLDRADPGAAAPEHVGFQDHSGRAAHAPCRDLADEGRRIYRGWASLGARRVEAVKAARRRLKRGLPTQGRYTLGQRSRAVHAERDTGFTHGFLLTLG